MKGPVVALSLAFALSAATAGAQETWNIDTGHSAAHFAVKHMLVSTVRGDMGPVKGTVTWDGKDVRTVKVETVIDVTQVNTRNEGRDKDLRSANFFEVEKYPEMTFTSTRVTDVTEGGFTIDLEAKAAFKRISRRFEARVTDAQFFFASAAAEAEYDSRRAAQLQMASSFGTTER